MIMNNSILVAKSTPDPACRLKNKREKNEAARVVSPAGH
jgi:hypothetical protein